MATTYKGRTYTAQDRNIVQGVSTGSLSGISLSADNIALTNAIIDVGGSYAGTGMYLTLNINGSALFLPLYQTYQ